MDVMFGNYLTAMSVLAVVVFVALYFVNAGYGMFYNNKWGVSVPNKWGWVLMEAPVFVAMIVLFVLSDRQNNVVFMAFLFLFELHYLQRAFVFPFMMRGKNRMPITIVLMGVVFNLLNALMQGGWLFFVAPDNYYSYDWLTTPKFIIGFLVFIGGMYVNLQSDAIIRALRSNPNDNRHYLPEGGMFKYVTSANYFGEFIEWVGFAILTWSWSGLVFALWTFANLAPRAAKTYEQYQRMFPEAMKNRKLKRIIPFIY